MKVLVAGSGAREHALAWSLSRSPRLGELHAAPGNPGIAALGRCHPVRPEDGEGLLALCREVDIDLVVVGPEVPLVAGVADELRHGGVAVFGPGAEAARIEGSKLFAKDVLAAAGVPAAAMLPVAKAPCVVKADGLAAGKGVFVCHTAADVEDALRATTELGGPVLIEELLEGKEISVFAISDGAEVRLLGAAQDYKRALDGDEGPNTGGMGSLSPVPGVGESELATIVDTVHRPVILELARRGVPYVGALFAGLMMTSDGPRVLEFNCRLGDPETQSLLPLLGGDLLGLLAAAATGSLASEDPVESSGAAVTIVLAATEYPAAGESGTAIDGIDAAAARGALVFHAGTAVRDGRVVTNGGRVLSVTGLGDSIGEARERAYDAARRISCPTLRFRSDIAEAAAARESHVAG